MKFTKTFFLLITIFFIVLLLNNSCKNKKNTVGGEADSVSMEMLSYNFEEDYQVLWDTVTRQSQKGLYRSALETVEKINKEANKDKNTVQVVKSLIYKMKYNVSLEEDSFVKALYQLQVEAKNAEFPLKQLIHSITAETFWNYYQQNQWKINQRTFSSETKDEDIRTWDLKTIAEKTTEEYLLSLSSKDSLQHTNIEDFKTILDFYKETTFLRPSLYDFLAYRALAFFENPQFNLTKPADYFTVNDSKYLSDVKVFSELNLTTNDSTSNLFKALSIYQELANSQLKRSNTKSLIETTLRRLKFVKSQSNNQVKNQVYKETLEKLTLTYKHEPEVSTVWYELALLESEKGDKFSLQNKKNQWSKTKALGICKSTIKNYPESYGAKQCKALISQIYEKSMGLALEKTQFPNQPVQFVLNHKNLDTIHLKLVKVDWDFKYQASKRNYLNKEEELGFLNKLKPVRTWTQVIENKRDYQNHSSLLYTEGLPAGKYYLLVSDSSSFKKAVNSVAFADFWVTSISYTTVESDNKNSTEMLVVNSETGKGLANVTIQQYTYEYQNGKQNLSKMATLRTDDKGKININEGIEKDYYSNSFYYHFEYKEEEFFTDQPIYQYNQRKQKDRKVIRTTLFTDRAIYRPGQTVYFKGITLEYYKNKTKILPKKSQSVWLKDVNYQKVKNVKLTTNSFGTFSGSFTLPVGKMNGAMTIVTEDGGSKSIRVEEYKRPKFNVAVEPITGSFKLNEKVVVKGNAKAFAGYVLDGAKVEYSVTRTANFPYWCWYRWGYNPISPAVSIKNGIVKTDEDGVFTIDFKALADEQVESKYRPTFNYNINISVTDINGETQSTSSNVSVGYASMNFSVGVNVLMNQKEKQELTINATNLNGSPVNAIGDIRISKLTQLNKAYRKQFLPETDIKTLNKEYFSKLFPYDVYDVENKLQNLKKEKEVFVQSFNTKEKSSMKLNAEKLATGRYVLEAKTIDSFGVEVEDLKYFTVFNPVAKEIPVNETWWTTDLKINGEPGEVAAFLIGTSEEELFVNYEIEHKGEIVYNELLELSNEQRKIEIPIEEKHRGNFSVTFTTTKHNRFIQDRKTIIVPYSNKVLDLSFESFRNKLLPGQKEEWKIKIRGPKGDKVAAELLATLYDASLDEFASNYFNLSLYNSIYPKRRFRNNCFSTKQASIVQGYWNLKYSYLERKFSSMKWFGYNRYQFGRNSYMRMEKRGDVEYEIVSASMEAAQPVEDESDALMDVNYDKPFRSKLQFGNNQLIEGKTKSRQKTQVTPRTNFNETAFFYPQLQTNRDGDVIIKFTIPESLTNWKFLALAHTKDLKIGTTQKELVTQKELMVVPNAPRFFREGDKISFSSKVVNLSEKGLVGNVKLELFDALTMQSVDSELNNSVSCQEIQLEKEKSTVVNWNIEIPKGYKVITYRVTAQAGKYSDGEEMAVPVLTNRMLVTESLPLPVKKAGETKFTFQKLIDQNNNSNTLENHKLTLEFTANPAWFAIQALPYLMEYPYECAEQTFSRYYANSIAAHIANSNPKIKRVFDAWLKYDSDAFLSNLEKNQELKALLLEETPWILNAQDEQERKKRIALLFDLNKMQNEQTRALKQLEKMQLYNGAWPWFEGMKENRYITQHIVTGLGHLKQLKVHESENSSMLTKAIAYLDQKMFEDYEYIKKNVSSYKTKQTISNFIVQYLYARSFYPNININDKHKEAYDYFSSQSKEYWLNFNLYTQGMIALSLNRQGDNKEAEAILASIKERAIYNDEMGMYWKDLSGGYYWYQAPIETQALLIEAFDEIIDDQKSVEEMKVWLLKQKQTTDWKTTKATADACYALLLRGTTMLSETDIPIIKLGNKTVSVPKTEAGTGYFKTSWSGADIQQKMGDVSITKKQNSVAWGALYWQYFEDLDKITPHETPLQLTKQLYLLKNSNTGKVLETITETSPIKVGDKIKVRVVLKTDRNLEYVHLKDMRASTFEPTNVISSYKWQDGLGYYETTKDASTNFFMDYIPKGTYVFEYELIANQKGSFSNGITSIQCMYAPEFTSHSEGLRIEVE